MDANFIGQWVAAAELAGNVAGTDAAIGFVSDAAHAARLVGGLDDGDPEVLDTLPTFDLSGQRADGATDSDVLDAIESAVTEELAREALVNLRRDATTDELVETYRTAFEFAVSVKVETDAHELLRSTALDEIESLSAYSLADSAQCTCPDSLDSPGAEFLVHVRDEFVRRVRDDEWSADDGPSEIADDSVPIYTWPKWRAFVDLGAWQEDLDEVAGGDSIELDKGASLALYLIAERLVHSLAEELGVTE